MPARVTRARARRAPVTDENQAPDPPKSKATSKTKKPLRAPLADRTNSASDENTSAHDLRKKPVEEKPAQRPRRAQRAPARLAEHKTTNTPPQRRSGVALGTINTTPEKKEDFVSPFKTPKGADTSIVAQRPRRMQRLPSRFSDHALSPSKFVALKPSLASTPLPPENKTRSKRGQSKEKSENKADNNNNPGGKVVTATVNNAATKALKKGVENIQNNPEHVQNKPKDEATDAPKRARRGQRAPPVYKVVNSPKKTIINPETIIESPSKTRAIAKYVSDSLKNRSIFKSNPSSPALLSSRKSPKITEKLAVYEFTYDSSEEPKLSKKKIKKQTIRKKAAPRRVYIKDNYSKNVEKQLENLKLMLSKKTATTTTQTNDPNTRQDGQKAVSVPTDAVTRSNYNTNIVKQTKKPAAQTSVVYSTNEPIVVPSVTKYTGVKTNLDPKSSNNNPMTELDHHDDFPINYSPISTPHHVPEALNHPSSSNMDPPNAAHNRDPLNLADDLSFFDDIPVASSSIMSTRKSVAASPWRVDIEVHSRWPVNMYVKPNMTPAYESSFINVEIDQHPKNKKPTTGLFTDETESGGLKQTSILSFIKEVVQKKAQKAHTPIKNNSVFDGSHSSSSITSLDHLESAQHTPNKTPEKSKESESSPLLSEAIHNQSNALSTPDKVKKSTETTKGVSEYFGFSDGEDDDQENVSPQKKAIKTRVGRTLRSRPVLKEFNKQKPMRLTTVPAKAFAPTSAIVNKMFEDMKSTKGAPVLPEVAEPVAEKSSGSDESLDSSTEVNKDKPKEKNASPTLNLFEDVELVRHQKVARKSYGKARKVTFQQSTVTAQNARASDASDDDNDETFTVPRISIKRAPKRRKKKAQGMTQKEKEDAEKWAAGFNSMIEEVDEFPLLIE